MKLQKAKSKKQKDDLRGLIYVFTGEGKGKTSAALGVATRSLLLGHQVIWVSFYKEESWGMAEAKLVQKFNNLEMKFVGRGFQIPDSRFQKNKIKVAPVGDRGHVVVDKASEVEHREAAKGGLQLAANSLQQKPFLLVMDEVLNAVSEGLVTEHDVVDLITRRGTTHLVLTGRGLTPGLKKAADLVTECRKIKHPYDEGKLAVAGLDF